MADREYLQRIGLTDDQISELMDGLHKESRFRSLLIDEGINPGIVEAISRGIRTDEIDFRDEALLREKIRAKYGKFIRKQVSKLT